MAEYPEDAKVLELFQRRLKAAQDARKEFDDKCDVIDRHYEPWKAKWPQAKDGHRELRTGHIHHILETMSANMVEPDPAWDLRTHDPADEPSIKATRAGLSDIMQRDGWPKKNMRLIRAGNRYGLAVAKIGWDYDERVRYEKATEPHPNPFLRMFGKTHEVEREVVDVLKDDATVSLLHRSDFWPQPRASCIEEAEWCLERMYIPLEVLEQREAEGYYRCIDMVKAGSTEDGRAPFESEEHSKDRRREYEEGVEVFEMHDKVRGTLTCIANRSVVIHHGKMEYEHGELPYAVYTPIPVEDRFEGISPVEPLIPIQEATWLTENDRMRAVAMALNPTLLVNKSLKQGGDFHIRPGGRIFVNDTNDIQQLNINAQQNMGFGEVQALLGYMQQVSGVSPFIAGSDPSGYGINQDTATGVNQLAGAAGRRIGFHIQQAQDCIARIGTQVIQLMNQYLDTERMVQIVGESGQEWVQLSPEEIPTMFALTVKGSTENLNKQGERQQAIELLREIQGLHGLPSPDGRQFTIAPAVNYAVSTFDMNEEEFWVAQTEETQAQLGAETQQAVAGAEQAAAEAQMASPEMQMMMQQMQQQQPPQSPNDLNGDGIDDLQRKVFESINFKDLPVDAQAAYLDRMGLPSDGLMQQEQLEQQTQLAKIRQMTAQAANTNSGLDNA